MDAPARRPAALDRETIWRALEDVMDPEIPVLSLVDLGIVRAVEVEDTAVQVDLTPTFSGCPAFEVMRRDVAARVLALGASEVEVRRVLSPAWSTDEMSEGGREKLLRFGLAPPAPHGGLLELALEAPVPCPRCGSFDTVLHNAFGSALCREIHGCRACGETFERFKPL
jgi:ring-1,2-phenylacetyl-CoA epoxidase subunit PaaD